MMQVEKCAMPAAMRASLKAIADLRRQTLLFAQGTAMLALACAVLIAAFFVIAPLIDGERLDLLDVAGIVAMALAVGAFAAVVGTKDGFRRMRADAATAAARLKDGTCEQVRLDLPADHLVIDNDGQYFCFFPLGDGRCLFADVGGHEADPRLEAHARGDLFRATWWWKRLPHDARIWDFETGGDPLPAVTMVSEPDDEERELTDLLGLEYWPLDGDVVHLEAGKLARVSEKWRRARDRVAD